MATDAVVDNVCAGLGYRTLKEEQRKVIASFVRGEDVFAVLPTGYGKSLCFACLPLIFDKIIDDGLSTIVVILTPLTAIVKDQVHAFRAKGLSVGYICDDDDAAMKADVVAGNFQLVFFTPEALLLNRRWRQLLLSDTYQRRTKGLVIDEAHTVQKWGATFRHALLKVGELRSLLPETCHVMALTATANLSLRLQLVKLIGLKKPTMIVLPPCKANLFYVVLPFESIECNFAPMVEKLMKERISFPRTIVYCRSMDDCANLYLFFQNKMRGEFTEPPNVPSLSQFRLVEMFTSCTDTSVKNQIITSFTQCSCLRIVCATIAFGMGVNCQDVREVVHLGPPDDVESYIQETGRAGRDNLPSRAILFTKRYSSHVSSDMKAYCSSNKECRRHLLFKNMEGYNHHDHSVPPKDCCDVCMKNIIMSIITNI